MYSFRKLYRYICDRCGKKRQSMKKETAMARLCGECKQTKVPENQLSIFDALDKVNNPVENGENKNA